MRYILISFAIVSTLIISGCNNNKNESNNENEKVINEIKQENDQLKEENQKLSEKNQTLSKYYEKTQNQSQDKIDELNKKVKELQAQNDRLQEADEKQTGSYESLFQRSAKVMTNSLGIIYPQYVKAGDAISGLNVSSVAKQANRYTIDFNGNIELTGFVSLNEAGPSKYLFYIKNNLKSLPHLLINQEKGIIYFEIQNEKDLEQALGDQLKNLTYNHPIKINAVFTNYSVSYVPESDASNTANFVRLNNIME